MADTILAAGDRPPQYPTDRCRSCQAPVIWVALGSKGLPVDAEPVAVNGGGGSILLSGPEGVEPKGQRVRSQRELFGKRWVWRPHSETCPYAARYRSAAAKRRGRRS